MTHEPSRLGFRPLMHHVVAWLCAAAVGVTPLSFAQAQDGDQDPLSFARTITGYDAAASQEIAVAFAGEWRVAILDEGKTVSGVANVAKDGGSITLVLKRPEGEERYHSVEIDAMKFAPDTGPFTATLGVRFKKDDPAAPEGEDADRSVTPLFVERQKQGVTFELDERSLELGVDWADDSKDTIRMRVMSRGDIDKLQGRWVAEVGDNLTGGGGASWLRGAPEIAGIVVADDQSDASAGYNYPYAEDGTPKEGLTRTRTLVVYGRNLPDYADQAEILSRSGLVDYGPDFRAGNDRNSVFKSAYEKAGIANADDFDALLVTASLKPGAAPGTEYLTLDGAVGGWPLLYANQAAALRFVRDGDVANDVFYPGDIGYVRLSFESYLPLDEIAISISRGERDKVVDGVLIARRVNDDDPVLINYMTEPVHFYHRSKPELSPPPDENALRVPVLEGAIVTAELVDRAQALTLPPVAKATIYNGPDQLGEMWKDALSRVAASYGETIDDFEVYQHQEATKVSHVILTELGSRDIALKKGDIAAAILIRDEFAKLTMAAMPAFEQRSRSRDFVVTYREQAKKSARIAQEPFWGTLEATYVKKGMLWDSETTVPMRDTLNEAEMAKKFKITEAEAKTWAIDQTLAASAKQVELMQAAVSRARDAGDCNVGELLLIAGHRSPAIVGRILPRLVKLEEFSGPPRRQYWAPDHVARGYVKGLYIAGAAVRALEDYSEADTNVGLAVAALATLGGTAALEGLGYAGAALWTSLAADAFDMAYGVMGVEKYLEGENYYDFARGAAPTMGDAVLDYAVSKRQSATMTALGVLLPAASAGMNVSRLRGFKNVQHGKDVFRSADNVLGKLSELSDADRTGLAGYYADMLETVKKSGLKGLDEADRAAFDAFQDYFKTAGVEAPSVARTGDDLVRTASRAADETDEVDPFAVTRREPAPSSDPRLDETIAEPPPAGDPRLDETIAEPPPMDPRLDPRGRDIFEIIDDAPIDDSPPLPRVENPAPDFSNTPAGSLSDHLSPSEIQDLFEPGRNLTPDEILQKADLIRSGRVPPEMAQGDPRVLEALDEVFGIKTERPPFTDGGTIIEPAPNDPRFAETADFPPPTDPRLAETTDFPPPTDPRLAETTDFPPPDPNATLPPNAADPNATLPPPDDPRITAETVDSPLRVDPDATVPPSYTSPPAPASFGGAIDASFERSQRQALRDLADYKPGASDRLGQLDMARKMLEAGSPQELEIADRLHRAMTELGIPEENALSFGALHYRRPPGPFSQRVTEAEIIAESVMFYGTRSVDAGQLAAAAGISRSSARAVIEDVIRRLGYSAGRLSPL